MKYIIDGHNLIAKVEGLSLSMIDDEQRLVERLTRYAQQGHHQIEVYFDGAPAGHSGTQSYGLVRAHYISHRQSADAAIRRRMKSLERSAKNWVLVTSDRSVMAAGHEAQAQVMGAEEFARQLQAALEAEPKTTESGDDKPLSQAEVEEWQIIFKHHKQK